MAGYADGAGLVLGQSGVRRDEYQAVWTVALEVMEALRNGVISLLPQARWTNIAAGLRSNGWWAGAAL